MAEVASKHVVSDEKSELFQSRAAGISALIGAALMIGSNALQQRAGILRGNPLGVLAYINERPWFVAALAGIFAMLSWIVALSATGRTLKEPTSRVIVRIAEPLIIVAVTVFAVNYGHDGFGSGIIAQRWRAGELTSDDAIIDARVVESLVGGTSILSQSLLGLALSLYAIAILRSGQFSRFACWSEIVGTVGWFVGGAALFLRLPGASFELLLPFVGLATIWVISVGITLIRRPAST